MSSYARYSRPLFSYAFKFLKDRMIAEEVLPGCLRENLENGVEIQSQALPAIQLGRSGNQAACIDRLRRMKPESIVEDPMTLRSSEDIRSQQRSLLWKPWRWERKPVDYVR